MYMSKKYVIGNNFQVYSINLSRDKSTGQLMTTGWH